ncbi:RING finger protein 10 [Nibea albiflora]|uniref:RING finger protein 10 n=1 Tax=Nibea albiflora TaxID=240163 RepID=A0ACB7FDG9_NIBAL|nr:RING finger protein 10 [Nibea albiflora]
MLESSAALCSELGLNNNNNNRSHCAETNMEKNPNNSSTSTKVPPRSSSTGPAPGETKPKTDGKNNGGSKRYSRKREPSFPKADSFPAGPRRTNSQKSKNFDKRPSQRGGRQYGVTGGGRREEVAETRRAEFSPAQFAGPKKISLNHLLNFTFEPRGGNGGVGDVGHSYWGRRNKWGHKHKPFNKELFLQANCQFVVTDDQDYKAHFTDPDTLVNWDCVQQVSWSKCPICYEAVHTADLKSVVAMETRQYVAGDVITMRLMRREKGSLVAMPSSQWVKVEEPVRFGDACLSPYSKLLLTSPAQVLSLVSEEKAVLQAQLSQEEDAQGCFIQSALCLLQEREEALLKQQKVSAVDGLDVSALTLDEVPPPPVEDVVTNISSSTKPVLQYSSAFDDEVAEVSEDLELAAELPGLPEGVLESVLEESPEAAEPQPDEESPATQAEPGRPSTSVVHGPYYYFYQADDCQQMFLHPVNVRCLLREYGSLEASPDSITATVVEIVGHTVTEVSVRIIAVELLLQFFWCSVSNCPSCRRFQEIRRRHRYLAHLPLTCEFSICELSLQPPIISKETLDTFADDLEKRKRLRQKKVRDEKRREKRIEMEENKKQGKYPEVHIGLENLHHFPAFGSPPYSSSHPVQPDFTFAPPSPLSSSPTSDGITFPSLSGQSSSPVVGSVEDDSHCMSFAQMLRDGKARVDAGPRLTPKKDNLLAPPATADSDGESDGSDRVPVPSFQNSFSQAIEKALLQLDNGAASPPKPAALDPDERGGKKKKKKQKLLFSTSMVHTK